MGNISTVLPLFLAGLIGYILSMVVSRLYNYRVARRIHIWQLHRKLGNIYESGEDRNGAREMELQIQASKLYSSDITEQGTAVSQLAQLNKEKALKLLVGRLEDKPRLSPEIRNLILSGLGSIVQKIQNANQSTSEHNGS